MTISFTNFKSKVLSESGLLDSYRIYGEEVCVTLENDLYISGEFIKQVESLEEARAYAKEYIENTHLLEDVDNTIPQETIAQYITKYHNVDKITDTLIESYIALASSNEFSVDPVITAIKQCKESSLSGKFQYKLTDGTVVAISEQTQSTLNILLSDKPEIVDYMKESKTNFMRIIKDIGE